MTPPERDDSLYIKCSVQYTLSEPFRYLNTLYESHSGI